MLKVLSGDRDVGNVEEWLDEQGIILTYQYFL